MPSGRQAASQRLPRARRRACVATALLATLKGVRAAAPDRVTIVSAANSRFASKELAALLELRQRAASEGIEARLIAYDLGDLHGGRCVEAERWRALGIEVRRFDFDQYPPHVAQLHCYAWKAPIVAAVAAEAANASTVVWVDSGVAFHRPLRAVIDAAKRSGGFVSDATSKSIARFSHERMLDYFVDHYDLDPELAATLKAKRARGEHGLDSLDGLPDRIAPFKNCNGAFSAHVVGSPRFARITARWLECSLDRACVCPRGSTRANHRQDQAAMTLLALVDGYACGADGKFVSAHGLRNHAAVLHKFGLAEEETAGNNIATTAAAASVPCGGAGEEESGGPRRGRALDAVVRGGPAGTTNRARTVPRRSFSRT